MDDVLVRRFMTLAGQPLSDKRDPNSIPFEKRALGAKLLLSEVLEYVIEGLGVTPTIDGTEITDPNGVEYKDRQLPASALEMVDGLADVAYTMYWNSIAFGVPLDKAFQAVSENNLEKFVKLHSALPHRKDGLRLLVEDNLWHLNMGISWPKEVTTVELIQVDECWYAVGKDSSGKVRKPSSYTPVDLTDLAICQN
jgi:hypothetical protein